MIVPFSYGQKKSWPDYGGGPDQTDITAEHPFHALQKLLNSGNFYYSVNFDLTSRLQDR